MKKKKKKKKKHIQLYMILSCCKKNISLIHIYMITFYHGTIEESIHTNKLIYFL